ncbi:Manganese-binding lipoprotein MntA [Planktothrix tepida]|uniref:Adhesin n=2 Tax=Planktothrix TaxID=54304 RepID=A0A1J1LHD4_9CYAN|nr:Manganese-binding lipoprotein MntA [Planktothrix tepida]CAD5980097.1 Manganese-binding lipoprotein MntA [Planktothrix pseudagardhii]CUR31442.1 Adhesin [Planktothrix tepida PCC 9214]
MKIADRMMKIITHKPVSVGFFSVLLGIILSGLSSCTQSITENSVNQDQPKVVSTSTIIADLTEQIGGDEIDHQGILQPGADPHVYEPVPQDSIALEKADLILYNGYNLEPGLIKLMKAASTSGKKVAVGEVIKPLDFQYKGQTQPDPHVWGTAKNAILMVNKIRDELTILSPKDKSIFNKNSAKLIQELTQLDRWIQQQIATIPPQNRKLVTTHDAFQYYAHAYGLEVMGTLIGISTEEQPSAKTVKNLSDSIQKTGVPAIFAETTINPKLITTVAEESGVKLAPEQLYSDSIGAPGGEGDTYVKMLVKNTKTIVEALGGKYTPFNPN